jgi:hypothetical protein
MPQSLDKLIQRRVDYLTAYQNAAYAAQYSDLVAGCVRRTETGSGERLSTAVAKYYFKLMAYKDEYEVAPVHQWRFPTNLNNSLKVISAEIQSGTTYFLEKDGQGHLVKAQYGSWIWQAFNCWRNVNVCAVRHWISLAIPQNVVWCADYRLPRSDPEPDAGLNQTIWNRQWRWPTAGTYPWFRSRERKPSANTRARLQALQQAGSARNRLITVLCDEPASLRRSLLWLPGSRHASRHSRHSLKPRSIESAATDRHLLIDVYVNVI